jgi:phosphoribosylaminoimidazolecarboxamide formyltransferase/IMP cyclohydrolase
MIAFPDRGERTVSALPSMGTLEEARRSCAAIITDRGETVRALLSVWDKAGVVELAQGLHGLGWELVSTGQTHAVIAAAGIPVRPVGEVTGSPEILGGRVKSLHPAIHGGILARRDHPGDLADLASHQITGIDLVASNLYPFVATIGGLDLPPTRIDDAVAPDVVAATDQIDIGGPAMVRAAAKNFADVIVLTDPAEYEGVLAGLRTGGVSLRTRARLAQAAFTHVAQYDATIAAYLAAVAGDPFPDAMSLPLRRVRLLSYGENPHQESALYQLSDRRLTGPGLADLVQHSGEAPSYNNLLDLDCAQAIVADFQRPAVAIVKHNNPCGVGTGDTIEDAYRRAYAGDPLSAFGGVVASNRVVDAPMARAMSGVLFWVTVAPGYTEDALRTFARRQTRVFTLPAGAGTARLPTLGWQFRPVTGGFLAQSPDSVPVESIVFTVATRRAPTEPEAIALRMAWQVVKHVRSNASVFVRDGAVRAVGAGQMSRVDSVLAAERIASRTLANARASGETVPTGPALDGTVMATDGFFADPDAVEAAAQAGATAIAHPGGGRKDAEAAEMADRYGVALVTTGIRHFRH